MALLVRSHCYRGSSKKLSLRCFGGFQIYNPIEEDSSSERTRSDAHTFIRDGPREAILSNYSPKMSNLMRQDRFCISRSYHTLRPCLRKPSSSSLNALFLDFPSSYPLSSSNKSNIHPLFRSHSLRLLSSQANSSSEDPTKTHTSDAKVSSDGSYQRSQNIGRTTPVTDKSFISKFNDTLIAAGKATVSFIIKLPGVIWFYITHSKERNEKWIEIKEAAKKEAHHYWMGTKLLAADIRTARVLVARTLRGSSLSRRERKQLQRTVTDIFRLVPFSVFVIVPFMEFTLPFFLRIFPNMLPSTYQDSLKEEENMKRELQSRLAMAEFFQETLQNLANEQKKAAISRSGTITEVATSDGLSPEENEREHSAESFLEFLEKARHGEMFPPEVIIRYATYFKDEMTLDNMPRMQLINMCKYMNIPPYGSDNLLRLQLRHRVKSLREDDQRIIWEGIDSLTKMELREACRERGMRSTGLSKESYRRLLQQWIELSVNRNVPVSLLIMSRIFFLQDEDAYRYPSGTKHVGSLADAITGMDKEVINEVVLDVATSQEKISSPDVLKIKLEVLQQQNELIAEEKKARDEAAAKIAEKEQDKLVKEISNESKPVQDETPIDLSTATASINISELNVKVDTGPVSLPHDIFRAQTDSLEVKEGSKEPQLSSKEIDAIKHLLSPDPVSAEREKLERLKAAIHVESMTPMDIPKADESVSIEIAHETVQDTSTLGMENKVEKKSDAIKDETISDSSRLSILISEKEAVESIKNEDVNVAKEAAETTRFTSGVQTHDSVIPPTASTEDAISKTEVVTGGEDRGDVKLDKAITRLKSKVESMVGKLEIQLGTVEKKIGDKLHHLDKDMDGILSREEMALCLQSVLKRPLSFDEAMAIAKDMDENEDGFFSLDELSKWLETNKLVKLVKEGKEDEVERLIAEQTLKLGKVEGSQSDNVAVGLPGTGSPTI